MVEGQAKLWSRFKGAAVEGKVGAVLPQPSLGCGRADQMLTPYEQGFLVLLALSLDPESSCFHCLLGAKPPRDDREEALGVAYYDEVRIWGRALSSLHPLPLLAIPDPQMERLAVDTELVGTWTAARSPRLRTDRIATAAQPALRSSSSRGASKSLAPRTSEQLQSNLPPTISVRS